MNFIYQQAFEMIVMPMVLALLAQAAYALKIWINTRKEWLNDQAKARLNEAIDNGLKLSEDTLGNLDIGKAIAYTQSLNSGDLKNFKLDRIANQGKLRMKVEARAATLKR